MSETINWNVAARADGGPVVTASGAIKADAYDKLEVKIAAGATQTVSIAPVNWTSVLFFALNPKQPAAKLSYKANTVDIAVDGSHFFVGAGAVALLGSGTASLSFTNSDTTDITVDILVGRKAV